mgnify:CR=1 FL=1
MNREILFRGKRANGCWVYGSLVVSENIAPAIYYEVGKGVAKQLDWCYVKPDTIGQYTGRKDKNRVKIFDGDIVRFSYITDGIESIEIECLAKVVFEDGSFMIKCVKGHVHNSMQRALFAMDYFNIKVEVVGNITDNPELMK